jgi:hypothetical protein
VFHRLTPRGLAPYVPEDFDTVTPDQLDRAVTLLEHVRAAERGRS